MVILIIKIARCFKSCRIFVPFFLSLSSLESLQHPFETNDETNFFYSLFLNNTYDCLCLLKKLIVPFKNSTCSELSYINLCKNSQSTGTGSTNVSRYN